MTQQNFSLIAALAAFSFSTLACGYSPLFNHANEITNGPEAPRRDLPTTAHSNCALELKKSALCVSFTWDTAPAADSENSATLRFWDPTTGTEAAGPYRNADGEVAVKLWMPSMGHGSSPVTVTSQGDGLYSASRVYFSMPGEWEVRVQIKKGGQLADQASFNIKL